MSESKKKNKNKKQTTKKKEEATNCVFSKVAQDVC